MRTCLSKSHACLLLVLVSCLSALAPAASFSWPVWDNNTPNPHTVFGCPEFVNHDPNHNTVREYGAFTVYYDDIVLSPRWTAIKMTRHVADQNADIDRSATFKTDPVVRDQGYEVTSHDDYKNLPGLREWDRGHLVQFDDARGYGLRAAQDSFYTTNICPQLSLFNQAGWLTLEQTCTEFARDYEVAWIYSGPIYGEFKVPFAPGRTIPKPIAFYKIVVSPSDDEDVDVLAFRMPHQPIPRDVDVSDYLVSVRQIEQETGLDFLHELPDDVENRIETDQWEIWPDLPNE